MTWVAASALGARRCRPMRDRIRSTLPTPWSRRAAPTPLRAISASEAWTFAGDVNRAEPPDAGEVDRRWCGEVDLQVDRLDRVVGGVQVSGGVRFEPTRTRQRPSGFQDR